MCLSTVFQYRDDPQDAEEVCSNISSFKAEEDNVVFTDLLGEEYSLRGTVSSVDFVQSRIYVAVS